MFFKRSGSMPPAIGCAFAGEGMFARTMKVFVPVVLSTMTAFSIEPILPARLIVTGISPLALGSSFQGIVGSRATVQPQEVRTLLMVTTSDETFVTQKLNGTLLWPAMTFVSLRSVSHAR